MLKQDFANLVINSITWLKVRREMGNVFRQLTIFGCKFSRMTEEVSRQVYYINKNKTASL